jgi:hypothetical protein
LAHYSVFIGANGAIRADGMPSAQARRQQFEVSADAGEQPLRAVRANRDSNRHG